MEADLSKVRLGQYVVVVDGKVYKKGKNVERMLKQARKEYPAETPFVSKIPERGVLVI